MGEDDEIAVTPEMIKAGMGDDLDLTPSMVEAIYITMEKARRRGLEDKKLRSG